MKKNIDFYQHYVTADQHPKFKMLRVQLGWAGEGKFWALNNRIAQAENCCLDVSKKYNKAAIASDLDFTLKEFDEFITCLLEDCELVRECEPGIITTDIVQENFQRVMVNREKARERKQRSLEKVSKGSGELSKGSGERNKKVKESKRNNTPLTPQGENVVDFSPTAEKIYQAYVNEINPAQKSKARAVKNISRWLKRGRSESDLVAAYRNYAKRMSGDPQYRKDPANFYGVKEDFCFDYMPGNFEPPAVKKQFLGGAF